MTTDQAVLVLRLAAPLQSWGGPSRYNRRDTLLQPTKSGTLGLLAAADGRSRETSLSDLLGLHLGVRVDQPGTLLRDYHTVSDHRGLPLPSAKVDAKGLQKKTSPAKYTGVTQRYYLQEAVFTPVLRGPAPLLAGLEHAVRQPVFPLSLGRRSCPPTGPVSLGLRPDADLQEVLVRLKAGADAPGTPARRRGFRVTHRTADQQIGWLLKQADRHGFTIPIAPTTEPAPGLRIDEPLVPAPAVALTTRDILRFHKRTGGPRVTVSTATFQGRLRVTNPDTLRDALLTPQG
ncbi:type I-E CRISPR-associated protein Cas5/CasD [Streptomyces mirabilis]|uniref:type I-E CRISPR-associated protein Cas5/CasD n=1 Tax=Streptomyces mirabilis TaxID=68239 RepID=UPI0036831987